MNFNNIEEAKLMIKKAKEINAFLCKFQLYNDNIIKGSKDYEFLKSIMLDYNNAKELYKYGKEIKQTVFFTPMTLESVDWVDKIGCKFIKTRFSDRFNMELIRKVADLVFYNKLTWFLSINEDPLEYFDKLKKKVYWDKFEYRYPIFNALYCVPSYPATIESYLCDELFEFGSVSDHTNNLRLFKIAQILDFNYFEKHVKLDNTTPLEDKWSISFSQLKEVLKP